MDYVPSDRATSKRYHRFMALAHQSVVTPLDGAVTAGNALKAEWQAEGMTAAVTAAAMNPDKTLVGFNFTLANAAAFNTMLTDLAAFIAAHPILAKIRGVN